MHFVKATGERSASLFGNSVSIAVGRSTGHGFRNSRWSKPRGRAFAWTILVSKRFSKRPSTTSKTGAGSENTEEAGSNFRLRTRGGAGVGIGFSGRADLVALFATTPAGSFST